MSFKWKGGMAAAAFLLVSLLAITPKAIAGDLMYGDADLSGAVDGGDLGLVVQCVSNANQCPGNADATGDDCSIRASDAFALQKYLAFSNVLPAKDPGTAPGCWCVSLSGPGTIYVATNTTEPVAVTLSNNVSPPRGELTLGGVVVDFTPDADLLALGCSIDPTAAVTDAAGDATINLTTGSTLGSGTIYAEVNLVDTGSALLNQVSVGITVIVTGLSCNIASVNPTDACEGNTVTIDGTNFGAAEGTVVFDPGSVSAVVDDWTDTSIVVFAPGGSFSNVTVNTDAGTSCNLPGSYSYDDVTNVTITDPVNGVSIIAGDVTVSGTADTDITTVTVTSDQGHSESSGVDGGGNWSVVLTGVVQPSIAITARGTDNCGNIGSHTVTVPVLSVPPIWFVDVDATGNNDGTSWTDAFTVVQDAADAASSGDWIWVAEGTYTYATGPSTMVVLTMTAGVEIYGGFTGTEIFLSERGDPADHPTILDGEDTSYHVVIGTSNARLDGFTITGGNANGGGEDDNGGGIYNNSVTALLVVNCTFSGNSADYGGGGIANDNNSSPTITNCTFSGNSAGAVGGGGGGGIANDNNSSPTITNCTFINNSAGILLGGGGGIANDNSSSPTITNCTFSGNSANSGGGIAIRNSSPTVTNCTFRDNSGREVGMGGYGGGIYIEGVTALLVVNCTFSGNSAQYGGGIYNSSSSPTITNCIFSGNSATSNGGGMYNSDSLPEINNCTFSGNSSDSYGGGMYNTNSSPTIINCIMWGDISDEIYGGTPIVTYSDIEGGYAGTGNIDADPLFVTGPKGDYYLSQVAAGQGSDSPCVDAGSDTAENLGLDDRTTSTNGDLDTGQVDMGYHYEP